MNLQAANLGSEINKLIRQLEAIAQDSTPTKELYRERALLLGLLSFYFPSHLYTPGDAEEGFDYCFCFHDGVGSQYSWHIANEDLDCFAHVPIEGSPRHWDGHTTLDKLDNIYTMIQDKRQFMEIR